MACELAAYTKGACADNGGTEDWYVFNTADVDTLTFTNGVVTALTLVLGAKAVKWTPDMESGLATNTPTRSRDSNSLFNAQTAKVIFKDDEDVTVDIVDQVAKGFVGIIIRKAQADGTFKARLYGALNGLTIETAEGTTGEKYEDLRGHTLNFVGKELTPPASISEAITTALLIPLS